MVNESLSVSVRPHSFEPGGVLALSLTRPRSIGARRLRIHLYELGTAETSWVATLAPARLKRRGDRLVSSVVTPDSLRRGAIYEVRRIDLFRELEGDQVAVSLIGGRDFHRLFLEVPVGGAAKRSARDLRLAAFELEEARRIQLSQPLGNDPSLEGQHEFRVVCFVERCLLTRPVQLQGYKVMPMNEGMGSADEAEYINSALAALGWPAQLQPGAWASRMAKERPIAVFDFPRVVAQTLEEAHDIAAALRDQTLDLFVIHRRARGSPLASFVHKAGTEEVLSLGEVQTYTGNLLGGFLSGEDPAEIAHHVAAAISDPLISLFVSLYRDASAERNPDFAYLRFWNLLEVVSGARVEPGVEVTDFNGNPLLDAGQPATSARPRGRVYHQIRSQLQRANFVESSFVRAPFDDLWHMTGVWYGFRNAAAHYGGFRPDDPLQASQPWFEIVNQAYLHLAGSDQSSQDDPFLLALRSLSELMLRFELTAASRALST